MAQEVEVTVTLVDDIDGGPADQTIEFSWQGKPMVIDLNNANAASFQNAIQLYLDCARPAPRHKRTGAPAVSGKSAAEANRRIRLWAKHNGLVVSARGIIPGDVRAAYDAARAHGHHAAPKTKTSKVHA